MLFKLPKSLAVSCSNAFYSVWCLLCAISPALAAAPLTIELGEQKNKLEEVIVTASKREQLLDDFSGSISVINNFSGINNLADIANQVPGFSLVDAGPRNPAGLVIRGLRMDEVGANDLGGDGSSVASYVDNIPLQGYFVPPGFSLKDLQQVEVLRGPQATLYGNASISGLVRYVTVKPDLSKSSVSTTAEISQTKESNNLNYDTDLIVNAPIISDTLGLRLMLGKTENKGFIDNPYLLTGAQQDINDDKTEQARVSLLWQATEDFSLASSYHYQKINVSDRQATNEDFTGDNYTASSRYLQPMQGELQLAGVDANYDMQWATLSASLNRYDYARRERADQTDFFVTLDDLFYGSYYTAYENFSAYNASQVDVVKDSAELRLVSPDNQGLRWLAGGFYSRDNLDVVIADYAPGFAAFSGEARPDDLDYYATQTETLDEYSAYAELAYDLAPKWEATLGARHFRYNDDLEVCTTFYPTADGAYCEVGNDVSTGSLGKFSTRYKFSEQQAIYFIVAEGYRRGGANVLPPDVNTNRYYNPDKAINYELGTRNAWMNQHLQLNAAIFVTDWNDIQVSTITEEGLNIWANAKGSRSLGIEVEGLAQLSDAFTVRAGYSLTDAKITETVTAINGGDADAYDGDRLPGSARTQWNLALDYAQSLNTVTLDANLTILRNGEIFTALNSSFYNYDKLDSFTTANARIGVSLRNWHFGAFVNNIANTRAITGKRSNEWYGEQGKFEYINRPRTMGVSASYQF